MPGGLRNASHAVHDVQRATPLERPENRSAHRRPGQVHVGADAREDAHRGAGIIEVLEEGVAVTHALAVRVVHARREPVAAELEHHGRGAQRRGVLSHDVEVVTQGGAAEAAPDRSGIGAECDGRHEVILRLPCERVAVEDHHGGICGGSGRCRRGEHSGGGRQAPATEKSDRAKNGRACHEPTVRPSDIRPATDRLQPSNNAVQFRHSPGWRRASVTRL